jgi:hypothetical protein
VNTVGFGRKGKAWEACSRTWLHENHPGFWFGKLINPERIDWAGIGPDKKIMLVESKHCNKKNKSGQIVYYPMENKRRREQLAEYFRVKELLISMGYDVTVAFLICKGVIKSEDKQIIWKTFGCMDDVAKSY